MVTNAHKNRKNEKSDKVLLLLSGGFDSAVAGWFLKQKANLIVHAIHFDAQPFSDGRALIKAKQLCKVLGFKTLFVANLGVIQKAILEKCPESWLTVLSRRAMLNVASELALRHDYKAIATGDALGQVASQTLQNLITIKQASKVLVAQPLLGFDKQEIIDIAKQIGVYEIASQPAMDCGLTPKKPVLRASVEKALGFEKAYKAEIVLKKVLESIKVLEI